MFDRWLGNQERKEQDEQAYHRVLTSLYQQVQSVIASVDDIINNLSEAYPKEALSHLSGRFEAISREFSSYTIATSNMFYQVVSRSKLRKKAAKNVATQAKRVAKLFEKYARSPRSYSPVDSRLEIYKVRDMLDNLLSHCI
jgi:hypothetical protein